MPNIWSGRNRPLSVSESHSEDSSPSTETRGAPVKTMTATWCHHAAKTITSCVRCTYVNTFIADIFLRCFVLALFKCTHVRLICCKINIYISKWDEVRKTTSFVKKKMQFPVTETIGWYVLHVKVALVWMCYWFAQTSRQAKNNLYSPTYSPFSTRLMMSKALSTLPSRMSNLTS